MKQRSNLDKLDNKIISILEKNSRTKNTAIAKQLDITEGAVRKRVQKLINNGVIEKFTIVLSESLSKIGAIVAVRIGGKLGPSGVRDKIYSELSDWVFEIYEVTGEVDLFVVLSMETNFELKHAIEKIRSIEGVDLTKTHSILTRFSKI